MARLLIQVFLLTILVALSHQKVEEASNGDWNLGDNSNSEDYYSAYLQVDPVRDNLFRGLRSTFNKNRHERFFPYYKGLGK